MKKYLHIQTDIDENNVHESIYLISEKFFFEYFFPNNFYEVIIAENLYYLILSKNKLKLFIFDKSLKYKSFFDLTTIKKIYSDGKYSIIFHFFEDQSQFLRLKLTFFSILEKENFLKNIFEEKKEDQEIHLKKILLLNFLSQNNKLEMALVNQLIMFNKNILKRKSKFCSALYFNKDIYGYFDYNTKDISINEENTNKYSRRISQFELNMIAKKFSKKLFFVFNNYKILDQFMRKIFYGINIIKYKYKYYKSIYDDCVLLEFENNLINENFINENETKNLNLNKTFESELLKDIFNKNDFRRKLRKAVSVDYDTEDNNLINLLDKKNNILDNAGGIKKDFSRDLILNNKQNEEFINCSNSSIGRSNSEEEFNSNKKRLRHNVERKKNNCENFNNYRNSLEESITIKSDFEKVSFEVNLCYYFSKESRVINIYKDGIFTIYKKGKVK